MVPTDLAQVQNTLAPGCEAIEGLYPEENPLESGLISPPKIPDLDLVDNGREPGAFKARRADEMRGVVKVPDVLRVHLEERSEARHDVPDPSLILPLPHPLLQPGQEEVVMELEEGLDVGEHLGDELLREHPVGPVFLIDPELEHLGKKGKNGRLKFLLPSVIS